jgi:hypothetical protein
LDTVVFTAVQARPSREVRSEQLVAICPEVLNAAEHTLGNLFQRIHHIARVAREGLGANAERMTGALSDIQEVLDLVFDYVTPISLERRPVGCDRIAESLAANVRALIPDVRIAESAPAATIEVDVRVLSRSLQILVKARARELGPAQTATITATRQFDGDTIDFAVVVHSGGSIVLSSDVDLAWEVAARLIELQGGELSQTASGSSLTITLTFPVSG